MREDEDRGREARIDDDRARKIREIEKDRKVTKTIAEIVPVAEIIVEKVKEIIREVVTLKGDVRRVEMRDENVRQHQKNINVNPVHQVHHPER